MKPSASALKRFLFCATATAATVVSSSLVVESEQEPFRSSAEETRRQKKETHEEQILEEAGPAVLWSDIPREHFGLHNHHKRDDEGVLVSTTTTAAQDETTAAKHRTPCHPDLGVLSCPPSQPFCNKDPLPSLEGEAIIWDWYCSDSADASSSAEAVFSRNATARTSSLDDATASKAIKMAWRRLGFTVDGGWDGFPPSGELYDKCTYDLGYTYNYNSTIRYPSGWDRCACEYYDYRLPTASIIYTDVEYCHKVNKYYCANYYDKEADKDPNAYDACLCSVYDGKSIPDKPSGFCTDLPMRYCQAYYAEGDVLGIAKCLCDTFEYNDWCNWDPPEGYTFPMVNPVGEPAADAPTHAPTYFPTFQPSKSPTKEPTKDPTKEPTEEPTRHPTTSPSENPTTASPTQKPTKKPTKPPKIKMTMKPTKPPAPTPWPTRPIRNSPTKEPTKAPTNEPTKEPTKKPTKSPTKRPVVEPTKEPTDKPTMEMIRGDGGTWYERPSKVADLNNVNKLPHVITTVRRQPNLVIRPGGSLRLPLERFFERSDDDGDANHMIGS